jgi:hypothetical protein
MNVVVSDHAIVRWAERAEGYDIDEIREQLESEGESSGDHNVLRVLYEKYGITRGHFAWKILRKDVYMALLTGASKYYRGDYTYIFEGGVIKTITGRQTFNQQKSRSIRKDRGKGNRRKKTYNARTRVDDRNR